jgi:hypothetical protein
MEWKIKDSLDYYRPVELSAGMGTFYKCSVIYTV